MNAYTKVVQVLCAAVAVLLLGWFADPPAEATPAEGVTFTVLNRATVPEFDVRRRFRQESQDPDRPGMLVWKIDLEATRMIDVVTVLFTVQPGGHGGWHTHPGPALFTIRTGTLTMYEADDPTCTPQLFPAGTGSVEAGTSTHNHLLRNETGSIAETIVTFLVPVGAPLRVDRPDPGHCAF